MYNLMICKVIANGRRGQKGEYDMAYEFVPESEYKAYRSDCAAVLKDACARLYEKGIVAQFTLIGSGGRGLVTRNGDGPFDLDYNLNIIKADADYWNDLRKMKETIRVALNRAEKFDCFSDAQDSTSCLTAILHFEDTPKVEFSFDVAIVTKNKNGNDMRLIHNKNFGIFMSADQYTWNEVPNSCKVRKKALELKKKGMWQEVRNRYLELKNMYLYRHDNDHPSFVVYVEAVNEIYGKHFR